MKKVIGFVFIGFVFINSVSASVLTFKDFAGSLYSSTRTVQMAAGQNLMIETSSGLISAGLDGSKWYMGFIDQDGYVIGWADNVYSGQTGQEGWLKGSYTSDLKVYDSDQRPNNIYLIKDTACNGIGTISQGRWWLGDDDVLYTEQDILFGPDKLKGAVNLLPSWGSGTLYLPEMIVSVPEPSTLLLFGLQGIILARRRRCKR